MSCCGARVVVETVSSGYLHCHSIILQSCRFVLLFSPLSFLHTPLFFRLSIFYLSVTSPSSLNPHSSVTCSHSCLLCLSILSSLYPLSSLSLHPSFTRHGLLTLLFPVSPSLIHPSRLLTLSLIHPSRLLTPSLIHPSRLLTPSLIHPSRLLTPSLIHPSRVLTAGTITRRSRSTAA